jgi:hypothetical protein
MPQAADPFSDRKSEDEKRKEFDAMRIFGVPIMIGMLTLTGAAPMDV